MILYLPVWVTAPDRKTRIVEFLKQAPVQGLISVAFYEGGMGDCPSIKTLWKYNKETELPQTSGVAEEVNRCIDDAYKDHDIVYGGATVAIRSMASSGLDE